MTWQDKPTDSQIKTLKTMLMYLKFTEDELKQRFEYLRTCKNRLEVFKEIARIKKLTKERKLSESNAFADDVWSDYSEK